MTANPKKQEAKKQTKGELRYELIIEAAEDVLITHGYHNFTLRKIAQIAGISIGNLQYYFPSKDDLIRALCDFIVEDYTTSIKESIEHENPSDQFENMVKHIIKDLNTERTTILFPELWSLANHDPYVESMMDLIYEPQRAIITKVIKSMNPALSNKKAQLLSAYITAAIEGFTIFVGHNKPYEKETNKFIDLSIQAFTALIMEGDIPKTKRR